MDWWVIESAHFAEELLHPAGRLVDDDRSAGRVCRGNPQMPDFSRNEYRLTRAGAKFPVANLEIERAGYDVDPLVLLVVEVTWPDVSPTKLEHAQRATGVAAGEFAGDWLLPKRDVLIEAVLSSRHTETHEHLFV